MRVSRVGVLVFSLIPLVASAADFDAAKSTNDVGIEVFRQLGGAKPGGNLIVSPYSIESGLALAYAGADGKTRQEMSRALHLPDEETAAQAGFKSLHSSLDTMVKKSQEAAQEKREMGGSQDVIRWEVANRLFGQNGYAFRDEFLQRLRDQYGAPFEALNFTHHPDGSRSTINHWVSVQTHNRIQEIVPVGGVSAATRLVLVNALYLKAPWAHPFEKRETQRQPFHLADRSTQEVPMLHAKTYLRYARFDNAAVVVVPYAGNDLQFVVILPDEGVDPATIARELTASDFSRLAEIGQREPEEISLWLPKFKIETSALKLGQALRTAGMRSAFDEPAGSADFNRIAPRTASDYLAISEVFHRTFVAIDEEGTEAAAATAITMVTLGVSVPPAHPTEVRIDRPFLFLIQHRPTGACLFLGRISDPR
jgi:serpin B